MLQDFGTIAAAPRRRRRLPAWVRRKTAIGGGRWVALGRRKYYAARREMRPALPAMYALERDHEGDVIFEQRDVEADALVRLPGQPAGVLLREMETFSSLAPVFALSVRTSLVRCLHGTRRSRTQQTRAPTRSCSAGP